MMKQETRHKIKGFLEGFIQGLIEEHKQPITKPTHGISGRASKKGNFKPFHEALLPEGILRINRFERSFSTKLGTTFEEVARLIAQDYHAEAKRGYVVRGNVSTEAIRIIENIINTIGSGRVKKDFPDLINEVL
ncbi:MAG TPA: TdeIII family type II restriction endonuclease, partial [Candidatus Bathyarchaeota archaeon]|nr:TdeIII family type II restriction endonuclease [Candidatus Bathyarchaeota archaeon]